MINQCDGCRRGIPKRSSPNTAGVRTLYHDLKGVGNYPGEVMACTAHLYVEEKKKDE